MARDILTGLSIGLTDKPSVVLNVPILAEAGTFNTSIRVNRNVRQKVAMCDRHFLFREINRTWINFRKLSTRRKNIKFFLVIF